MNFFSEDKLTAVEAKEYAQRLAFGPIAFQVCRSLVDLGILSAVHGSREEGSSIPSLAEAVGLPIYGVRVLVEAGLGIGLFTCNNGRLQLTRTGWFLLHDEMTRVNFDFVNDICYQGVQDLTPSITEGIPVGLATLGDWRTVYEGLAHLPPDIRQSWLSFDHFYSDAAFPTALSILFETRSQNILDIGGNTGRWARQCVAHSPEARVCIADLPTQIEMARGELETVADSDRISFLPIDMLDPVSELPPEFDTIWMSQFLDCFSEEEILMILGKCRKAATPQTRVFVLEPFWDRQRFAAAAFSLQMTSLYFTAIANGNSQMYASDLFLSLIERAGFEIESQHDNLGIGHSLIIARPA